MREHEVISADDTKIRVWHTEYDGPPVLMCPGIGSGPESWPDLIAQARVHSWYMRGTMGSDRPADGSKIKLADHVADALATLDDAGVDRCVVMGWSMGVTVAAELALRHPDRVSGLMLVAGAAGDSFESMLALPGIAPEVRRMIGLAGTRALRAAGPLLDSVLHRVPINDVTSLLLRRTGVIRSTASASAITEAIRPLAQHDWRWYFTLALALGDIPRQDLRGVVCPTTVLAGRYDLLASPDSMAGPAGALPQARVRILPNSHFLPLEAPEIIMEELRLLQARVEAVDWAVADAFTPGSRTRT